ncbi:hypothetical protein [Burkholderia territorii]|uniref:hypothetical protein n=1 Tax=Burkholderia territorii TaxID=1503055 RepID=UPI001E37061B|nr:hypothetical protein [Burkholderia territorii]
MEQSARWLKRNGFPVVATDLVVAGVTEVVDAIGFRSNSSAVAEAKASRTDFLADKYKPHRASGGLGVYRFYICPPGVIEVADLPPGWGLLHVTGRKVTEILRPTGNHWPPYGSPVGDWGSFQHRPDELAERYALYSIARRRSLSRSDERYEAQLKKAKAEAAAYARHNYKLSDEVERLHRELFLAERGRNLSATEAPAITRVRSRKAP